MASAERPEGKENTNVSTVDDDSREPQRPPLRPQAAPFSPSSWFSHLPATDHTSFFLSSNWPASPVGPLESWSQILRFSALRVLTDSQPACLFWGDKKVAIYNDAYAPLAGKAHPTLMGSPLDLGILIMWERIMGYCHAAERKGSAVDVKDQVSIERNGLVQETYFSGNFIPITGDSGRVEGFHNSIHETTRQILSDRRVNMLGSMDIPSGFDHPGSLASYVIPFLETNKVDIPMALLYEIDEHTADDSSLALLRGQIGVPHGHPMAVEKVNLYDYASSGLVPLFRRVKAIRDITTLPVDEQFVGIEWQGFGEPSSSFSILPLSNAGRLFGFLVVGANPRRPIDSDYHQFMQDVASKVSSIAATVITVEEAKRRNDHLEKQVADNERQIRFMAQNASVGMLHSTIDGAMLWANEQYHKLTEYAGQDKALSRASFLEIYIDTDHAKAREAWKQLVGGDSIVSTELHLKKLFTPPSGNPEPSCILLHSFPYIENGQVKSVMTCISDISALKWAERTEARKATAAAEAKMQQEEFIDMVSHEMRNPLSAIYTSADTITHSLAEVQAKGVTEARLMETLRSNADCARTIMSAARLQKRIIDDVLTLSKLEYQLLSISPQPMKLPEVVESTLKMFGSDTLAHRIRTSTVPEHTLKDNNVDWVVCDPARLAQILVNFLTNAIKFTKAESRREIIVSYGAVASNPRKAFPAGIHWAPTDAQTPDATVPQGPPDYQQLFLTLTVKDTGVGMTSVEMHRLFSRFVQASAKTSIKYGGSGLGLFISKQLTEKLGGEIGVLSKPGEGSLFGFYVKAQHAEPPTTDQPTPFELKPPSPVRTMSSPVAPSSSHNLNRMHVLIVEDNQLIQTVFTQRLAMEGCVVEVANHGLDALQRLRETNLWHENTSVGKHLDIILMDWEMPVMDGLTCIREIRALQQDGKLRRHIEIITTTANAREEQIQKAIAAGADAVISKPYLIRDLLKLMRERLSPTLRLHRMSSSP